MALTLAAVVGANAQTAAGQNGGGAVVIELYTSQGCSSCPPADALLRQLAIDPRVIALSMHVDYWDYLGWKDKFASPQFTQRQRDYARAAGDKMIYTPQMVIGGIDRVVGSDASEVGAAIGSNLALTRDVNLTLAREGDRIVIRAVAAQPSNDSFKVQLVRYLDEATVSVRRGENAGHDLTYSHVVTSWQPLTDWDAGSPLEMSADAAGSQGVAVIIQADGPSRIIAAAALP